MFDETMREKQYLCRRDIVRGTVENITCTADITYPSQSSNKDETESSWRKRSWTLWRKEKYPRWTSRILGPRNNHNIDTHKVIKLKYELHRASPSCLVLGCGDQGGRLSCSMLLKREGVRTWNANMRVARRLLHKPGVDLYHGWLTGNWGKIH